MKRFFAVFIVVATLVLGPAAGFARAQAPAASGAARPHAVIVPETAPRDLASPETEIDADNDSGGYTPPEGFATATPLFINGYVDAGFVKAQGDGTSFAPGDIRFPADYGVDAFAPAINSRGEVASTVVEPGRDVNGFLPRSVGVAGRPSFLLNTLNVDLRYQDAGAPVMVFSRVQFLPRFSSAGDATRVLVEQAFGRVMPFDSFELAISVGKFDSVFGVEYLDNQANIRTGITPSLGARYTTGQSVGAKLFFRQQIGPLWSALSINAAATNGGSMVESLQPGDVSLAGAPVLAARLGYELNLKTVQLKLGGSGLRGPRNDQRDRGALQKMWGADVRLFVAGIALSGEFIHVDEDEGVGPKTTALGTYALASAFHARVFWGQLAYAWSIDTDSLRRLTPYVRYERRHAWFGGYTPITVDRLTAGLRVDLWDRVIVKGEILLNREREGAPDVPNNVYTSSVVYQW